METDSLNPCAIMVDLTAIRRNYRHLRTHGALLPVIKADAYGHGMLPVARVLGEEGASHFAVSTVQEGKLLRHEGYQQGIVVLQGVCTKEEAEQAQHCLLLPLISSFEALDMLTQSASESSPVPIGLKCNTGMTRLGFDEAELPALIEYLRTHPQITPHILVSHLACADMPEEDSYTQEQATCFARINQALRTVFPNIIRSLANSAATLEHDSYGYEFGRAGISLYGGNPFHGTSKEALGTGLSWAMYVRSRILHIRQIAQGETVSYGRIFTAPRDMRIAIVGAGYAQGYSRGTSNKGFVGIAGHKAPQVGRVCMSMIAVDISHIPNANLGETAWIMGAPENLHDTTPTAQDWADIWGSIPYEVLCLMGNSIPRNYADDAATLEHFFES